MCLLLFVVCDDETQNMLTGFCFHCLNCHYTQSAIVTTDALSEGSRRVIVIVVKVIPAKTSFHAVCNNDHGPRRLSTKLAQDLDHGCARRVGYILSGAILYPVT